MRTALALAILLLPGAVLAKPQCKVKQEECQQARDLCAETSDTVLQCRTGKEKRCLKKAHAQCTKKIRKCCKKSPLETCCGGGGGGGGGPTTTIGDGGSTTTTLQATTTTVPTGDTLCTNSTECAGFACCNTVQGKCCVLGSNNAACSGAGSGESLLAGTAGCTSDDGVDFPPTSPLCGPDRPANCPPEAVVPVSYQCHVCADGKIMQTLYNTETMVRTPYP